MTSVITMNFVFQIAGTWGTGINWRTRILQEIVQDIFRCHIHDLSYLPYLILAIECISMLIIVFLLAIKMALCRGKQMTTVLRNSMEKVNKILDSDDNVRTIFDSYARYANILNACLTIWSFYIGLFLAAQYILEYTEFERTHNVSEENVNIPVQLLYWYPFDYQKHYNWVMGYQFFTMLFSDLYNSCLQALLNTVIIQISIELKILQYKLKNFTKEKGTKSEATQRKAYLNLRDCIRNHQKLIEHTGILNKALKYPVLLEYAVSSVMLASILVQVISGKRPIFNSCYFGILAFQWCVLSWNANEIIIQSQQLSMSLYESNWYEQGKPTNQLILVMVLRTRRPLFIQIGPFQAFTLEAAMSRLKLAYSYISVMT